MFCLNDRWFFVVVAAICIKEKYSFAVACDTKGYIYTSTSNGNIWVDASLNLPITTNSKTTKMMAIEAMKNQDSTQIENLVTKEATPKGTIELTKI